MAAKRCKNLIALLLGCLLRVGLVLRGQQPRLEGDRCGLDSPDHLLAGLFAQRSHLCTLR